MKILSVSGPVSVRNNFISQATACGPCAGCENPLSSGLVWLIARGFTAEARTEAAASERDERDSLD
jgi:hypothetical protein